MSIIVKGKTVIGQNNFGLFKNGDFSDGLTNFTWGTLNTTGGVDGTNCLQYTGGAQSGALSDEYIRVDTSKTYQMLCYAKTFSRSTQGNLAGGHIGFATYDQYYNFIDLHMCGGVANTYLTRALNHGDSYAYVSNTNSSQWYSSTSEYYFRFFLIYPPTHPLYSTAYKYTRIGAGDYNIYYDEITDIGGGELRFRFSDTFPNIGYSTPINTPVCNGVAGGSYNYALGAPDYPETWTRFDTAPFTGEDRTSSVPFRYGTRYIKFLILLNYNHGTDTQDAVWGLDNIFFGVCENGKDYRNLL